MAGANVYSPDADPNGTAEEQIKYIVEEANSGKKLTTEQILTLQTALAGAQTIQNTQLREAAAGILQQQANQLGATGRELTTSNNATIQDQRNLALGAAAGDADVAQQVQDAGTATTAMDLSGLQQTADAYGAAAAQGYANAGQYADTVQQAKGAYAQNLGDLRTATGTSNAEDLALFDQYAKSANTATGDSKTALLDYLGSTGQANAAEGSAVSNLAGAAGTAGTTQNALADRLSGAVGTAGTADEQALSQLRASSDLTSGKQAQALQTLDAAGGQANTADKQALLSLLSGQGAANTADASTVAGLQAAAAGVPHVYGPQYGADVVSRAGRATADPDSIAAQKRFLSNYEADSTPAITDAERFNLEIARRQREQEDRGALEATLRDLGARGIRSGGAEIGSLLGSAQNTGQTRMLADLAASRDAVARAERARASGANLASDMRSDSFGEQLQAGSAADAVAQFNKSQSQTAQRYAADLEHQQATEGFGRAQAVAGAQTAATGSAYQRAQDVYKAGTDTAQSGYQRAQDTSNLQNQQAGDTFGRGETLFGAATGNTVQDFSRTQNAVNTGLDVANTEFGQQQAVTGAQTGAAQDLYGRAQDTLGAAQGTAQAAYQRTGDLYNAGTDLSAAQYDRANNLYGDVNAAANDIVANAGTVADRNAAATQNYTDLTGQLLNEGQQTSGTAYDRATDAAKADQTAIDSAYTRLAGTDAAQRDVNKDAFNQAVQGFDASAQAQGVATGSTPSPIYDALGNVIGYNEERRAEDELNKKSLLEAITGGIL